MMNAADDFSLVESLAEASANLSPHVMGALRKKLVAWAAGLSDWERADFITIYATQDATAAGKTVRVNPQTGNVEKVRATAAHTYVAVVAAVPDAKAMAGLLKVISDHPEAFLSLGSPSKLPDVFYAGPISAPFMVESKERFQAKGGDVGSGLRAAEGGGWATMRALMFTTPSRWVMFDRDLQSDMPRDLAFDDVEDWRQAMCRIVPALKNAAWVDVPSTSGRVLRNGSPAFPGAGGSHHYVQISDPTELGSLRQTMMVRAQATGLGYLRTWGQTKGRPWTIFDLSCLSPERQVYDGQPLVEGAGLSVAPVAVTVTAGGVLDMAEVLPLTDAEREAYAAATGHRFETDGHGSLAVVDAGTMTLDTVIEADLPDGKTAALPLRDHWLWFLRNDDAHLRCNTPWRASQSGRAGFMRLGHNGLPFVHDSGLGITYRVSADLMQLAALRDSTIALDDRDVAEKAMRLWARIALANGLAPAQIDGEIEAMLTAATGAQVWQGLGGKSKNRAALTRAVSEARKEAKKALAAAAPVADPRTDPDDQRPIIILGGPDAAPADARHALAAVRDADLAFMRGETLVHVGSFPVAGAQAYVRDAKGNKLSDAAGNPVRHDVRVPGVVAVDKDALASVLGRAARFRTQTTGEGGRVILTPAHPPKAVVGQAKLTAGSVLAGLKGVAGYPLFANGALRTGDGFDPDLGMWLSTNGVEVEQGYFANAREAWLWLANVWLSDFPFVDDSGDDSIPRAHTSSCAVALALPLNLLMRPYLLGQAGPPLTLFTSPQPGVGKTLAVENLAGVVTGQPVPLTTWQTSDEEMTKILTSTIRSAAPFLVFDNTPPRMGIFSTKVDAFVTGSEFSERLLATNSFVSGDCSIPVVLTGVGIVPGGDSRSRSLVCRLMPTAGCNVATREFRHPDIMAFTRENRARILGAFHTIMVEGMASPARKWSGRFQNWAACVGKVVFNASGVDLTAPWIGIGEEDGGHVDLLPATQRIMRLIRARMDADTSEAGYPASGVLDLLRVDQAGFMDLTHGKELTTQFVSGHLDRHDGASFLDGDHLLTLRARKVSSAEGRGRMVKLFSVRRSLA